MRSMVLGLICAILSADLVTVADAQVQGSPEDETAIRAVIADMTDGFNRHDAMASSRMYTPDADFANVAGMQAKGSAAIEQFLAAGFATRLKNASQKTINITFHFIRPDVAIVHVTNQISGFLTTDGATEAPHNELSIRVFQKDNGIWRVSAFHNTSVAASFKRD